MLYKYFFISFLILVSCNNQKRFLKNNSDNSYKTNLENIVLVETNCSSEFNLIEVNENIFFRIFPNICLNFEEFTSQNKKVFLIIHGNLKGSNFYLESGSYYVLDKIGNSDNSLKIIDKFNLDFTNFGFVINESELKNSVLYKISNTTFQVIYKNENIQEGAYIIKFLISS